jgi:cytochrome c oxidase subunit II
MSRLRHHSGVPRRVIVWDKDSGPIERACPDGSGIRFQEMGSRMKSAWGVTIRRVMLAVAALLAALAGTRAAMAGNGQPSPWQINFQDAASPIMEQIHSFHLWLTVIAVLITLFVLVLLLIVFVRFNEKANPVPSTTTHHTGLEIAWTVLPVVVLVAIAIPSFRLLFDQLDIPKADLTVKATGTAGWTWIYEYPDHGGLNFISSMIPSDKLQPGQPKLLTVDNELVVPVNKIVRVQVTEPGAGRRS